MYSTLKVLISICFLSFCLQSYHFIQLSKLGKENDAKLKARGSNTMISKSWWEEFFQVLFQYFQFCSCNFVINHYKSILLSARVEHFLIKNFKSQKERKKHKVSNSLNTMFNNQIIGRYTKCKSKILHTGNTNSLDRCG